MFAIPLSRRLYVRCNLWKRCLNNKRKGLWIICRRRKSPFNVVSIIGSVILSTNAILSMPPVCVVVVVVVVVERVWPFGVYHNPTSWVIFTLFRQVEIDMYSTLNYSIVWIHETVIEPDRVVCFPTEYHTSNSVFRWVVNILCLADVCV